MKLAGRKVQILISEEGREILRMASVEEADLAVVPVYVLESEDLGLWIRVDHRGQEHSFLLRWEYVLGIDVPGDLSQVLGWKP